MAVYVDDFDKPYRGMKMSHMIADSREELLSMAELIGVDKKWIQKAGTHQEHFDICLSKKKLAIQNGAILITRRQLGRMTWQRLQVIKKQNN